MKLVVARCCSCGGEVECEKWGGGECGKCGLHYEWSESYSPDANELAKRYPHPIPVSERLPEDGQRVIAYISDIGSDGKDDGFWITATYSRRKLFDGGLDAAGRETFWEIDEATHWITMPPKPASSSTPQ